MGIKGLMKLISDHAPAAVKEREMGNYFSRVMAVDASMCLYQFLIMVRSGPENEQLTNDAGEVTSHLQGMFYRTIRLLEQGIKPVFVFDGKPPTLKSGELLKRQSRRATAEEDLSEAKETGDQDDINRYTKRVVRVTKEHNEEVRRLLRLMGVPVIEAPGEAEAQCAELVKKDVVWAVATEDMDALTFGATRLLRHITAAVAQKLPILEIELATVLSQLELTLSQFIDLCILCGSDYCESIKGIGAHKAMKLIKDYGSIEDALKHIDTSKYKIPDNWLYKEAHDLFLHPEVTPGEQLPALQWGEADREGLIQLLVVEKGFNQERVESGIKKLKASKGKASQTRIDSMFTILPKASSSSNSSTSSSSSATAAKGKDNKRKGMGTLAAKSAAQTKAKKMKKG